MKITYASYLQLDSLLALQKPLSEPAEHDETLFIVIHQAYELWFKQLLHELDKAGRALASGDLHAGLSTWKRARTIMKTLVGMFDILETMTPMSFTAFRDRLDTASGFQSVQFRELEFLLGAKRPELLKRLDPESFGYAGLERRQKSASLVDLFYVFLSRRGASVPAELLARDVTLPPTAEERVQAEVLRLYKNDPEAVILFELMMDFDEGLQEWRYRHVKLVERTIGDKRGTGGSPGAAYLRETLFKPVFPDLWAVRHRL